jgi:hypothetical protein
MTLEFINAKLAWAVLITGLTLTVLSGAFVVMTGASNGLLVAAFGAVAAQVGKISLRDNPASSLARVTSQDAQPDLVAA